LAAGILKQAGLDLRRFHDATSEIEREFYLDAYRWVMSDDCSWPFSFLNVCQVLNLAPETGREEVLGDLSSGAFGYWSRRCGRARARALLVRTERHLRVLEELEILHAQRDHGGRRAPPRLPRGHGRCGPADPVSGRRPGARGRRPGTRPRGQGAARPPLHGFA